MHQRDGNVCVFLFRWAGDLWVEKIPCGCASIAVVKSAPLSAGVRAIVKSQVEVTRHRPHLACSMCGT